VTRKLEALLDEILEVEFSFRNTADPATSIARLTSEKQRYVMEWVRRVASPRVLITLSDGKPDDYDIYQRMTT